MADTKAHQKYRSKVQMQKNGKGKIYPGVTTILKNLGWSTFNLLKWTREQMAAGEDPEAIKRDSGDSGTCCHKMVERHVRAQLGLKDLGDSFLRDFDANQIQQAENGFLGFLKWEATQDFRYVASEMKVLSEKWLFGGTADIIVMDAEGWIHLIDIKTGSGIYDDMIAQTASYSKAYEEQEGVEVRQNHIVRLDKGAEEGAYEHRVISKKEMGWGWKVFLCARELHELHKRRELK